MTKIRLPEEIAYLLGILCMAAGVACVSASNFGYSMIVAPAYLLFAKLGGLISFGTAEYLFQGLLLILMCLCVRKFRVQYLFSFVTAVVYGCTFDLMLWIVGTIPSEGLLSRILLFAVGTGFISISVALFVRTYLAPEVYELFVRELAVVYAIPFGRVKLSYDCISCVFSIVLSVVLRGRICRFFLCGTRRGDSVRLCFGGHRYRYGCRGTCQRSADHPVRQMA